MSCSNCSKGMLVFLAIGFLQFATLLVPWLYFRFPPKLNAHPTFRFKKTIHRNLSTLTTYCKRKWESVGLMDGYYVVGVTAIPYLGFGVLLNIVSKDDIAHQVTIGDISHCICPKFRNISSHALDRNVSRCTRNIYAICLDFYAK
jgi:hypothetical protein